MRGFHIEIWCVQNRTRPGGKVMQRGAIKGEGNEGISYRNLVRSKSNAPYYFRKINIICQEKLITEI